MHKDKYLFMDKLKSYEEYDEILLFIYPLTIAYFDDD